MTQYVEGFDANALSREIACWSTFRSHSVCRLRACFLTPSVEQKRFSQPGKPHLNRALAGVALLVGRFIGAKSVGIGVCGKKSDTWLLTMHGSTAG